MGWGRPFLSRRLGAKGVAPAKLQSINQSINQSISHHSTEARATVRLCRIKEKCLETELKCVNGFNFGNLGDFVCSIVYLALVVWT